jgi:hypothetical protein
METTLTTVLNGRSLYHATPLHYLPLILQANELRSQRLLGYAMGRKSARRRDRILGVDSSVHFSLSADTPLLRDKLAKGMPHIVLVSSTENLAEAAWSVLPCSTKAWRSKWQCRPVSEPFEMERILRMHDEGIRYRGLEILVQDRFLLTNLSEIIVHCTKEGDLVNKLLQRAGLSSIATKLSTARTAENYIPCRLEEIAEYFENCWKEGKIQPPPNLEFD